ncbi:metallophosphoesterase family protein [Burkholderia gladioli]|uniref:metallophosphoesterase family protein n=1 Tax=Burkholderia gladioli TaxID=28095 RepID=UPI0038B2F748
MQLRWLHISDLHAGQDTQDWLWPGLQTHFFDDLERLIPAMGGLDLVIFSGDLTQRGSEKDFTTLRVMLDRIWNKFGEIGCRPQLFMVPGNHDLVRPDSADPVAIALQTWWENAGVRDTFWKSTDNVYRKFIDQAFSSYTKFREDLLRDGFPLCPTRDGLLPGDCSHVFVKDRLRLGLVGLNSTFLQLGGISKLDLDVRQLLAVTDNDPDFWCRSNHVNLLITHHPASWLSESAIQHLRAEIYPPTRFTAHLFGHMHAPDFEALGKGGSTDRKMIQAASLYGLRKYDNGNHDRIHGYSGARLEVGEDDGRVLIWPRIGTTIASGSRKFVPDNSFDLSEQNNFTLPLGRVAGPTPFEVVSEPVSFGTAEQEAALAASGAVFTTSHQVLKSLPHHHHVRRLEQGKLRTALDTHRVAWISADWGYAVDEFIASVVSTLTSPITQVHRINLNDYRDRETFLSKFAAEIGCSFQEFCKSISGVDRVLLVLDDAPVSRPSAPESASWELEVATIVEAIREYCPNSVVILVSRQLPSRGDFLSLDLKPLDEPDIQAYIANHSLGGPSRSGPDDVADILRLTGGLPVEIDGILRELEFISLPELIELRLTTPTSGPALGAGPEGLVPVINSLKSAADPDIARAFDLLVALSAFPYGETLARIKRFDSQRPFYPSQAAILADRGLIESIAQLPTLKIRAATDTPSPKLVAKKIVRDTVEASLTASVLDQRDVRAASLYFGDRWLIGEPKSIRTEDLAKALGGDGGLGNPHAVINSLLRRAVEAQDSTRIKRVVQLARLFIANLGSGDNYRSSVAACQDFLKLIPLKDEYKDDDNYFQWNLARCYRMLGKRDAALEIFENLETTKFERRTRQRILLNWALATERSDPVKAKDLAAQTVALGKATLAGLHAQALLLQLSPEVENRFEQLRTLERRARSKKAAAVANNIAFFIATSGKSPTTEKRVELRDIAESAKRNGDPYSAARAIVALGLHASTQKSTLTRNELSGLIEAYHYLYNERISSLFKKCHEALWTHFMGSVDIDNLLRLFRHSSFIWRIYGMETLEAPYIQQLSDLIAKHSRKADKLESAEGAYLLMRSEKLQRLSST